MESPSTGKSGFTGKSSFNGALDASGAFNNIIRFHSAVINAGILELIARLQALGRSEIEAREDFEAMQKEIQHAVALGEKGIAQDAVNQIRDAYQEFCYNPDVPEKDKKIVTKVIVQLYPELLNKENAIRRDELEKMCDEIVRECEKEGGDTEAWYDFKNAIKDAYEEAKGKNPLQLELVRCKAASLPVAQKNLEKAGIAAKVFLGNGNQNGYILVPKAGKEIERLTRAAVIDAAVKCEQANILSEESMNIMMQLRGFDDRQEMSGLTLAEAEAVAETMYGKNAPIVIKEPAEPGGHFSIVYCKENEELVNSVVLQEMIRERGAGYSAHVGDILETNYKARQGADLLLSKLSEGKDTFGYVVDVDHPDHYLLVTSKGITEHFENGEKDFIQFDKMPNPTNYSVELKERTMQLAPRIMFFPAKEAKACGLTREEYTVSDELKAKLETVKNPNNKVVTATQGSKEETEKYKNKVQAAVSTQTMFARYAVNQARNSLPKNASLPMLAQYVAQNTSELISAYKHECMKNIESKPMSQSEKDKAIGRLNYSIKSLRGQTDLETSMEDTMKEVYNQIAPEDARVKTADYQPNQFTATRLDSQPLDEQEIAVFRQNMKQTAMVLSQYHTEVQQPEAPRSPQSDIHIGQNNTTQTQEEIRMNTSNAFERHVVEDKSEIRASLEAVAHKNEGMVQAYTQHLSDKFPKEKAEAIAVSNVLLANMKDAVLGGKELPPADKYLKEYHVIPEESAARIAEKFEKITGINLETYDQMVESSKEPNKDADKQIADKNIEVYRDKLESLIKDEVQRAVSTGMKEKISQQNLDRNDER